MTTAVAGRAPVELGEPVPIVRLDATACTIPTDRPESDGTLAWGSTTVIIVEAEAGGRTGVGYAYTARAAEDVVTEVLRPVVLGADASATRATWDAMNRHVRNIGRRGLVSSAMSAVDIALWDLKARLLELPLLEVLGAARPAVPAYGSGGFTSYTVDDLCHQLEGWAADGYRMVKMKVGRSPDDDTGRVRAARAAIGSEIGLFVDANGAYDRSLARRQAAAFSGMGVSWFEEPVSSDDPAGLRLVRDTSPPGLAIAAGEYVHDPFEGRRLLDAGAVDVLQLDATRCGGVTGFLLGAALCDAYGLPLSAHTAPSVHATLCCVAGRAIHVEDFHDHARIEPRLFEGAIRPENGVFRPDPSAPGLGIEIRWPDVDCYRDGGER